MERVPHSPGVLVVDDDDIVLGTVRRVLEKTGYRVLVASTVADALEMAPSLEGVSVAILDYGMPEMSGSDLGHALTAICPGLRILISSVSPELSLPLKPDQRFLAKPFNSRTLLAAVLAEVLAATSARIRGRHSSPSAG